MGGGALKRWVKNYKIIKMRVGYNKKDKFTLISKIYRLCEKIGGGIINGGQN